MLLFGFQNLIKNIDIKNVLFKDFQTFFLYSYKRMNSENIRKEKKLGHELKFNILSQQVNTSKEKKLECRN